MPDLRGIDPEALEAQHGNQNREAEVKPCCLLALRFILP
jgi:hypothetical protein